MTQTHATLVRDKAAQLVRDHAARLGMDEMAAGVLVRAIESLTVPPEIKRAALVEALNAETRSHRWQGDDDQQFAARINACRGRRRRWKDVGCDEKDGSCTECSFDMAEALETKASKRRRKLAAELAGLLREEPFDDE